VKPVADEYDWLPETRALIERATSLGLTLAPVGKPPWGWELRYADGTLVVHGKTEAIAATLGDWPREQPQGWTIRADGVVYALEFQLVGPTADGRRVWRTYFPSGMRRHAPDYFETLGTVPGDDVVEIVHSLHAPFPEPVSASRDAAALCVRAVALDPDRTRRACRHVIQHVYVRWPESQAHKDSQAQGI
jgi:hypothetical protein